MSQLRSALPYVFQISLLAQEGSLGHVVNWRDLHLPSCAWKWVGTFTVKPICHRSKALSPVCSFSNISGTLISTQMFPVPYLSLDSKHRRGGGAISGPPQNVNSYNQIKKNSHYLTPSICLYKTEWHSNNYIILWYFEVEILDWSNINK